jgi:hypothetical protein
MNRRLFCSRLAALGGAALLPPAAAAATPPEAAGVPAWVGRYVPDARAAGEGDLRWYGLRVYTARLWASGGRIAPERFADVPFALDLRYAVALEGAKIAERSAQEIERMGFGDPARRGRWQDAMKRVFPDVARGDRLTGIHAPGRGARFYLNDRAVGAVDDPEFAAAFFSIWLDPRTVAPALREALVRGGARG